eukprot:5252232-Ditylum_brightwellii.AAC.1
MDLILNLVRGVVGSYLMIKKTMKNKKDHEEYSDEKWDRVTGGNVESTKMQCYWNELQHMDFADKDVVEILKQYFSDHMKEKEHHTEPG